MLAMVRSIARHMYSTSHPCQIRSPPAPHGILPRTLSAGSSLVEYSYIQWSIYHMRMHAIWWQSRNLCPRGEIACSACARCACAPSCASSCPRMGSYPCRSGAGLKNPQRQFSHHCGQTVAVVEVPVPTPALFSFCPATLPSLAPVLPLLSADAKRLLSGCF